MKLTAKLGIATASVALSFAAVGVNSAQAAFVGDYDISKWTLSNNKADGYVHTNGAPNQITLFGGDIFGLNANTYSSYGGTTDYTTTAAGSGAVSFSWDYFTYDDTWESQYDPFQFVLNNNVTDIFNNELNSGSDTFTTTVAQGDVFGFRVATRDNKFGRGRVTISNFNVSAAPVPEPATIGATVVGAGVVMGRMMKRKLALSKKA